MRPTLFRSVALVAGAWTFGCAPEGECGVDVDLAWDDYRGGAIAEAHEAFQRAVEGCPDSGRAKLGLAYTALRRGELDLADTMFHAVAAETPEDPEVLVGLGILRWRTGDFLESRTALESALAVNPDDELAQAYLQRFPAQGTLGERARFERPDTLVYPARAVDSRFEIRTAEGWQPFYVQGVNLGAATPSMHPSQFPGLDTYASWLPLIAAMGANTIRVYTVHPPDFYVALREYNLGHPEAPLWLLHGVWTEAPPGGVDFDHPGWRSGFLGEIRSVLDVIHGQADLPLRSGRAAGTYTADVSGWTLGLILGREWEGGTLAAYQRSVSGPGSWNGRYVEVVDGTPIDVWMARAMEEAVAYETEVYSAQRPIAYTNWPPTDPLHHPTESTSLEERAIRRSFGDTARYAQEILSGDDVASLDATVIEATSAFPAGNFASYHVYPYYPDFMVLEPRLNEAESPWGPSNFWGYLTALRAHHGAMPVLVAEYGAPASIGIAHMQPQGWHGGGSERNAAFVNARLTREIQASGMAGGIVSEWIDEWFKAAWNTSQLETPRDADRLWYNRMDAEEHYGMLAIEPPPAFSGVTLEDHLADWRRITPLLEAPNGVALRATTDEAYVWLLVEFGGYGGNVEETFVGLDVVNPEGGDFRWPEGLGSRLPVGLEFVLRAGAGETRLMVDESYNVVSVEPPGFSPPDEPLSWPAIQNAPATTFRGLLEQEPRPVLRTRRNEDGVYQDLRVLTNRSRFGRDSTGYSAIGYNWGALPEGPLPDGLWEQGAGVLEVRIPWQLLNVSNPSQRRVLAYDQVVEGEELGTMPIEGIRLFLGFRSGSEFRQWPTESLLADLPLLKWEPWTTARWTTRLRPSYWLIREAWAEQGPISVVEE